MLLAEVIPNLISPGLPADVHPWQVIGGMESAT